MFKSFLKDALKSNLVAVLHLKHLHEIPMQKFLIKLSIFFLTFHIAFKCFSENLNLREKEINACSVEEVITWNDGVDKKTNIPNLTFVYVPGNEPSAFSSQEVTDMVKRAVNAWSTCGISTQVSVRADPNYSSNNEVMIIWNDAKSMGNIGASDTVHQRLYLSPSVFKLLKERRPTYDSRYTLQMTLSHEIGHFYGLVAHSKRCVDVLSYYKDASGAECTVGSKEEFKRYIEYRSEFPTACDLQRCRRNNQ